jgi:NAD(P)-dependent dehydrogenase (short-subunit alcohol dehydrogenase family)
MATLKGNTRDNLKGKTCLVTGASSGLGLCTVKRLARRGAEVILVCRDGKRGQRAVQEVMNEVPGALLDLMICDFARFSSLTRFVDEFNASHDRLDVLFNNAAIWKTAYTMTEDGLETMFQVNCLATFLLMESLMEPLKRSPDGRIINIAAPNKNLRLDLENTQNPGRFNALRSFLQTKLWLAILSAEFSRRQSGSISVFVTEPGPGKFRSNITREFPAVIRWAMDVFAKTADQAARTIEYLVTVDDTDRGARKIFFGTKERPMPRGWTEKETAERIWNAAKALLAEAA